ncbi:MAG: rhomboid family intramembrane serine protease [Candidatus Methylomirabilales bacterium]
MLRKRTGSSLCPSCGKLNSVDAPVCSYCGRRNPGLWGFGPGVTRLLGEFNFTRVVIAVCIAVYVLSLLLDLRAAARLRNPLDLLAPSGAALNALGMTGAYAWALGRWWTLFTAIYLHGSLLHILFNLLWIHQLAPAVEDLYGRSRLIVIFTVAGVLGFVASNWIGVPFTIGASGSIFGLLGAMVSYGRSRGGAFGVAILRQYGQWALVLFILGFLMAGVNNFAHAGGFAGGYLAAMVLGHNGRQRETPALHLAATASVLVTALSFILALWTGLGQ